MPTNEEASGTFCVHGLFTIIYRIIDCVFSQAVAPCAIATAKSEFDIPAAPILLPEGPWKEIDGCLCAPKGFKAQGVLMWWWCCCITHKFPISHKLTCP